MVHLVLDVAVVAPGQGVPLKQCLLVVVLGREVDMPDVQLGAAATADDTWCGLG